MHNQEFQTIQHTQTNNQIEYWTNQKKEYYQIYLNNNNGVTLKLAYFLKSIQPYKKQKIISPHYNKKKASRIEP